MKPPLAKFSLQIPVLKYTTSSIKTESPQGSSNEKVNDLSTQVLDDGFIGITLGKLGLYLYPFDDGNHLVSAGYMITDNIELGVDLGLNQSSSQGAGTKDSTQIGAWGYYYSTLGSLGLENGLSLNTSSRTDRNPPNPDAKSDEFSIKISSTVVYPLAKNLRYLGGAFIRNKSLDGDGGIKTSTFQFGFILAGLRLKWI
ncbi:MAG TPA: hypothetical protein VE954_17685 [Oligoflexus sp.]|uniref:hypothetical protein n=1 Tax=Oligoflexus sp. TaxID=1971216 RepID=UPI002D685BD8|nr:hypothetical protein [Oligoflexus sp.]HYX34932.1 hypothetical protein [Oligoflexus sp.]